MMVTGSFYRIRRGSMTHRVESVRVDVAMDLTALLHNKDFTYLLFVAFAVALSQILHLSAKLS